MRLARRRADADLLEMVHAVDTFPAEHRMIVGLDPLCDGYRALAAETLVLLGGRTKGYLAQAAHFLADSSPSAQLVTLPGLDHNGPEDHPDRVADELRGFFEGWHEVPDRGTI